MKQITDLDLAPIYRTQANYWKAQYFQARTELTKANKGLRRLRRRLDRLDESPPRKGQMKQITQLDIATIKEELGNCDWMRAFLNGYAVDCIVWLINRVVELEETDTGTDADGVKGESHE